MTKCQEEQILEEKQESRPCDCGRSDETLTQRSWTAKLMKDISAWVHRQHAEINYYLTQFLTGHGCFHDALYKMEKVDSAYCPYEDCDKDDAQHTFFECHRWEEDRGNLERQAGTVSPDDIIEVMIPNQDA